MYTSFDETVIHLDSLVPFFLTQVRKTMSEKQYYIIDSGRNFIELFIIYPCRSFNITNIQSHEILNEGIISSSLMIEFKESEYTILLHNFEWIDRARNKHNLDHLYQRYMTSPSLSEKVKYYGILKSGEISIAETFNNLTVIIEEVIKKKSSN